MSARIVYRFHPFFDREVIVLRRMRQGGEPSVLVRVERQQAEGEEPELRIVVPCWMLEQAACTSIVLLDQPRVEIDALIRLRTLVDALAKTAGNRHADSSSITAKGDRHETRSRKNTSATGIGTAAPTADA